MLYCTDHFVLALPEGHRFTMAKYALEDAIDIRFATIAEVLARHAGPRVLDSNRC